MAADNIERAVEDAMSEALNIKTLTNVGRPRPTEPNRMPTLLEQFDVYEKCGVELRRRLAEERSEMIAAYERQVAAYEEDVRSHMAHMKADLDRRLREHDLLARRLATA